MCLFFILAPLQLSSKKRLLIGIKKYWRGIPPIAPPKVAPAHVEYTLITPSYSYALFCKTPCPIYMECTLTTPSYS